MSPLAICFLIAGQLVKQDDIGAVFQNIAWYFATVMGGLAIHGCLILPGLYILLTRTNPLPFFANMFEALATAFGTASRSDRGQALNCDASIMIMIFLFYVQLCHAARHDALFRREEQGGRARLQICHSDRRDGEYERNGAVPARRCDIYRPIVREDARVWGTGDDKVN